VDGFREPAVCAIATEVSTRASSAIVVINFRMLGFQSGPPHDDGNGKLDHKVRQASRFVQILQRAGDAGKNLGGVSASAISAKAAGRNPGIIRTMRGEGAGSGGLHFLARIITFTSEKYDAATFLKVAKLVTRNADYGAWTT
jgi:hypothetical protein